MVKKIFHSYYIDHDDNMHGPPRQQVGADIHVQQHVPLAQNLPSELHNACSHVVENLPDCISSRGDDKN